MIKRLIRNIMYWAFELGPDECFVIDGGEGIEGLMGPETDRTSEISYVFCRARPGQPGGEPEHIHQYPNTAADQQRYRNFGWMASNDCLLPTVAYEMFDGNGSQLVPTGKHGG